MQNPVMAHILHASGCTINAGRGSHPQFIREHHNHVCHQLTVIFKVELVVGISAEYLAAIIAAHNHMLRLTGEYESW